PSPRPGGRGQPQEPPLERAPGLRKPSVAVMGHPPVAAAFRCPAFPLYRYRGCGPTGIHSPSGTGAGHHRRMVPAGSPRLALRRVTPSDVDLLVELDSDPEVLRYLSRV